MVSESDPTEKYLMLQKLDTLAKVGNGRATKIIIPSELQEITGLAVSLKEATSEVTSNIDLAKEEQPDVAAEIDTTEDEF